MNKTMKLLSVMILISLLWPTGGFTKNVEYGIKLGLTVSNIQLRDKPANHELGNKPNYWFNFFESVPSLNVAGYLGLKLNRKLSVQVEPGYISKGAEFNGLGIKLKFDYFNLPVLFGYNFLNRFSINVGPEFSYLLKASISGGTFDDIDDFYNTKLEVSGTIGLNYRISKNFDAGLRYNFGLTKISETVWLTYQGTLDSISKEYHKYFQVYVRYIFNRG